MTLFKDLMNSQEQWLTPVILTTREAEIRRTAVRGRPSKKVHKTPSQPTRSWAWWHLPVIPAIWEA
jgi:hypothetical protein